MKKVLLIGDSIRQGYCRYVKEHLKDSCQVFYPIENCRFAQFVLRHLSDWKEELAIGDDLDLIHWNVGLWDTLEQFEDGCLTPPDLYGYFMERICKRIKVLFPKAKVIFATSTPILEGQFKNPRVSFRRNSVICQYNEIAKEIAINNGFAINDLYSLVENAPKEFYSDMTHLYTPEGTYLLANAVVKAICESLDLTYEEFTIKEYYDVKNVLGH